MRPGSWIGTAALLSAIVPVSGGSEIGPLQHRLATLTGRRVELVRRLAAIEADRLDLVVLRAPVDIQDRAGNSIVFISKGGFGRGFTVINERKQGVAGVDGSTVFALAPQGAAACDCFAAFNKNGVGVAAIGARPASGAGYLTFGEPGGNAIVEAGVLPDGRGVVRAYPLGGKPPIPVPNLLLGARTK